MIHGRTVRASRARKINMVDLKKGCQNFRENLRSAPELDQFILPQKLVSEKPVGRNCTIDPKVQFVLVQKLSYKFRRFIRIDKDKITKYSALYEALSYE